MIVIELRSDEFINLLDREYLTNTVGWTNYGSPVVCLLSDKVNEWYYYDNVTKDVKTFKFDMVECSSIHGFGGTSFDFHFRLGGETVVIGFNKFAPTIKRLKEEKIKELTNEINWIDSLYEKRIQLVNEVDNIKKL